MLLAILLVLQILVATSLIAVILLQRSEGGALGMGGGPSGFMTARGAGDLLSRTTAILAAVFFILCLTLTIISGHMKSGSSVVDRLKVDALNPAALNAKPKPQAPAGQPAPQQAPGSGFEAPRPEVNTAPAVVPGAPPTAPDSGSANPASQVFGAPAAPQAPAKPASKRP